MKDGSNIIFPVVIVILVIASACVAPPKPTSAANSSSSSNPQAGTSQAPVITTPTPQYVTIETPYQTPTTPPPTAEITTIPVPTLVPDVWVEIYRVRQYFSYNNTAFSYNVKNPPMVIHFSLKPVNISGTKTIVHHYGSTSETTEDVAYDYYSPYSWFEVTVRNKDTGQILGQSGFGNARGNQYPQNVNMTLKVLNRGDMHVELEGNYITATVDVSVKKKENIE